MIAEIGDHNISGHITIEVESPEELVELFNAYSGTWYDWDGGGVAVLSEPWGYVYKDTPDEFDPYPDWVVEPAGLNWEVSPC